MRDRNRIEPFCESLASAWKKYFPDWRFGQFVVNFLRWYGHDPFFLEDDEFKKLLDDFVRDNFEAEE